MIKEFWKKWQLWPKNVINQILQSMYALIFTLDSSNVYGSTQSEMRKLRSFKNGLLKTSTASDGGELLPQNRNADCIGGSTTKCFLAGDSRVNEQPNLAVMHTLFLREHNRIGNLISCIVGFYYLWYVYWETKIHG